MSMHEILEIQSIMDGIDEADRRAQAELYTTLLSWVSAPPDDEKEPEPWDI